MIKYDGSCLKSFKLHIIWDGPSVGVSILFNQPTSGGILDGSASLFNNQGSGGHVPRVNTLAEVSVGASSPYPANVESSWTWTIFKALRRGKNEPRKGLHCCTGVRTCMHIWSITYFRLSRWVDSNWELTWGSQSMGIIQNMAHVLHANSFLLGAGAHRQLHDHHGLAKLLSPTKRNVRP